MRTPTGGRWLVGTAVAVGGRMMAGGGWRAAAVPCSTATRTTDRPYRRNSIITVPYRTAAFSNGRYRIAFDIKIIYDCYRTYPNVRVRTLPNYFTGFTFA